MAVLPNALQFLASIPPVTRAFTAATILSSFLYCWLWWSWPENALSVAHFLTIIPASSLFYPWTFLTAAFVETSVVEFFVTLLFVTPSLRYLERLWGSIETLKFILVSIVLSNLLAAAVNWLQFFLTRNADQFLYDMQYHGQMALQAALLVAFTQLIPEHQVQIMGVVKVRVKMLPMAYVTLSTVLTIIGFQCPWILIQFGWFFSWVYLRFYKRNSVDTLGGTDTYGDRSETFSLVSWFPPFMHAPVSMLATVVHRCATRFHLIPSASPDIESGGAFTQLPGGARAEAERRRAMALKALDQRLANSASSSSSAPQTQAPRPPQAPSASKSDGTGPAVTRASERKKSVTDNDTGDGGNTNSENS